MKKFLRSSLYFIIEAFFLVLCAYIASLAFPGPVSDTGISWIAFFSLIPVFVVINRTSWIHAPFLGFIYGFMFFIFNVTAVGYFQSTERVVPATTFALMRGFILLVPCFLLMPRLFGSHGIWLAMPAAEALTAVMIAAHYIKNTSGLGRLRRR